MFGKYHSVWKGCVLRSFNQNKHTSFIDKQIELMKNILDMIRLSFVDQMRGEGSYLIVANNPAQQTLDSASHITDMIKNNEEEIWRLEGIISKFWKEHSKKYENGRFNINYNSLLSLHLRIFPYSDDFGFYVRGEFDKLIRPSAERVAANYIDEKLILDISNKDILISENLRVFFEKIEDVFIHVSIARTNDGKRALYILCDVYVYILKITYFLIIIRSTKNWSPLSNEKKILKKHNYEIATFTQIDQRFEKEPEYMETQEITTIVLELRRFLEENSHA